MAEGNGAIGTAAVPQGPPAAAHPSPDRGGQYPPPRPPAGGGNGAAPVRPRAAPAGTRPSAQPGAAERPLDFITAGSAYADRVTVLVIGRAGVGKTSLIRTIPEDESVFVVSAESGLLSVQDLVASGRIKGVNVRDMDEVRRVAGYLGGRWRGQYQWVFVDSLTELALRIHSDAAELFAGNNYGLWDSYNLELGRAIRGFRDLPGCNVVFTCLERLEASERSSRHFVPDVPGGKTNERIQGWFDEVMYMTVKTGKDGRTSRIFFTSSAGNLPAKDRSGRLDREEEAHLGRIRDKILGLGGPGRS